MTDFNSRYSRMRMISIALAVLSVGTAIALIGFFFVNR